MDEVHMIEITTGTTEEKIIRFLLKTYPVTISDIENDLNISKKIIFRVLQKFQTKNIVKLEPLPNKIYIRLLRHDFSFIGKKHQRRFLKHKSGKKIKKTNDYDGMMYH